MSLSTLKKQKVVLFIGETGVGKSSLVSLILGTPIETVSGSVLKGTFTTDEFNYRDFRFLDTVGYNDVQEKKPGEAIVNLAKFCTKVLTDGISLIVYVMKMGKVTATSKKNYEYFVKTVCMDKVPVLLFVTHCEMENDAQKWYRDEEASFREHGMHFSGVVCGCAIDLTEPTVKRNLIPFLKQERDNARRKVMKMIEEWAMADPWKPENSNEWLVAVFVGAAVFGLTVAVLAVTLPALIPYLGAVAVAALSKVKF